MSETSISNRCNCSLLNSGDEGVTVPSFAGVGLAVKKRGSSTSKLMLLGAGAMISVRSGMLSSSVGVFMCFRRQSELECSRVVGRVDNARVQQIYLQYLKI